MSLNNNRHSEDDHAAPEGAEAADYWLIERRAPGLERNWAQARRPYTAEATDRVRIAEAIGNVRWHRLNDRVPLSPGLMLQELIRHARAEGLDPLAMGIGADPLEYPEPHLLDKPRDAIHPGYFETGYLIALRQLCRRTTLSAYFLVLNDTAGQVVLDIENRPLPDVRMTRACAARLHELCRGVIGDERCECPCGHHTSPKP
jgi:hypothetical protein